MHEPNNKTLNNTIRDGVSASGIVVAMIEIIYSIKQYHAVNIFRTCLKLKRQRPEFISCLVSFTDLILLFFLRKGEYEE